MGLISLLFRDPATFFVLVTVLLYSVIFHEMAHGWVASRYGDNTAKYSGRLSLNPLIHLDPIGTLTLFLVGFGWAKPVPVNYSNLTGSRKAIVSVALAGCLTNIVIATIALILFKFLSNSFFGPILLIVAQINIILGSFNLIPIPPLDGSRVLMEFLPYQYKYKLAQLEPYGFFIIIVLLFTGILYPLIMFIQSIILGIINLLFHIF
jgi:Zn-dependent protease